MYLIGPYILPVGYIWRRQRVGMPQNELEDVAKERDV